MPLLPGRARSRRPASITSRIRRTASGRPIATASPTRKWPMFSSTISAIAATGRTLP